MIDRSLRNTAPCGRGSERDACLQHVTEPRLKGTVTTITRRAFFPALTAPLLPHARAVTPDGKPGVIHVGTIGGEILVIDEDKEQIVERIKAKTGIPRRLAPSFDRKKILIWTPLKNGIEILDLATRKISTSFVLDQNNRRVSVGGYAPDPQDKVLYASIQTAIKESDRFVIEKRKFAVIDLAQQKITKEVEIPMIDGRSAGMGGYRVSPDGKLLYVFGMHVWIFDTSDFKLVDTMELTKPQYPGVASFNFGLRDDPAEAPGTVTGVFNSTDPVVRRSVFGLARFDLNKKTFDFTPIGPAANAGVMGLQLTPDKKTGYCVTFEGQIGNRRCEFWVFEMATRKVLRRVEFDGPVNFGYTLSGTGKNLYIHGSYPVIEVWDAATLKLRNKIELNSDLCSQFIIVPKTVA
jgi:DNA-binding beta-propeller fold protein YncE